MTNIFHFNTLTAKIATKMMAVTVVETRAISNPIDAKR
ncbi:hypothetical protein B4113_2652 [Geobacillus sp. B4113_201601]|nr:hypothetical protein B4113_2652 [Geobacillus sp. B4113_201601]